MTSDPIAVVGGTGTLGRLVASELIQRGAAVRVLSRHPAAVPAGATHHRVDLTSGDGLGAALLGVGTVIDAANATRGAQAVLVDGTRTLLAAEVAAGVGHHVLISIVGCDRVPVSYYKAKVAQEQLVTGGTVPWTLLRATQFPQLLDGWFTAAARWRVRPTGAARFQPVDPALIAARLVELALAAPAGRADDVGGPEVATLTQLSGQWARARGRRGLALRLPSLGRAGRAMADGALCTPAGALPGPTYSDWLSRMADQAAEFQALRPRMIRIAYGVLGSRAEAEDVVQDAWLRLQRSDAEIRDLSAWLSTVVGRLALDALSSARRRREQYPGEWLPEPLVAEADDDPTLDASVSTALMAVLERLSPAERTAFLLHDVFGLAFDQVAEVVGRSPAAVRQLAARARGHVAAGKPRFPASEQEAQRVVAAFAQAWQEGEHAPLLALLDPDVVLRSDGGGHVAAARHPLHGADRVARALLGFARVTARRGREASGRMAQVNGTPGLVVTADGAVDSVVAVTIDSGRITAIDIVRNPEKLRRVAP